MLEETPCPSLYSTRRGRKGTETTALGSDEARGCVVVALNGRRKALQISESIATPVTAPPRQRPRRDTPHDFSAPRNLAGSSAPRRIIAPCRASRKQPNRKLVPPRRGFFPVEASVRFLRPRLKQPPPTPLTLHQPTHTPPNPDHHRRASVQLRLVDTASEKKRAGGVGAAASSKKARASGGGLEREILLMAAPGGEHQKRRQGRPLAADLLQNCDLPPPAKLYGPFPTLQRLENAAGTDQKGDGGGGNDSLLRALQLSQSRAREAEEKLAAAGASNGDLAALLVRDSVALSAHRRWVMMLEVENSVLSAGGGSAGGEPEEDDGAGAASRHHGVAAAWWVALAVCVSIAGVGLALGRLLL